MLLLSRRTLLLILNLEPNSGPGVNFDCSTRARFMSSMPKAEKLSFLGKYSNHKMMLVAFRHGRRLRDSETKRGCNTATKVRRGLLTSSGNPSQTTPYQFTVQLLAMHHAAPLDSKFNGPNCAFSGLPRRARRAKPSAGYI